MEDSTDSCEVWDILKTILANSIEQRLAYLLFHCGLKPREIMHFCPQEFSDVRNLSFAMQHRGAITLQCGFPAIEGQLAGFWQCE